VQTDRTKKVSLQTTVQPNHVSYGGTISAFRTIVKTEGVLALYQGLLPNLIGASVSWGLYILMYVDDPVFTDGTVITKQRRYLKPDMES
jgi:hypothetical protein